MSELHELNIIYVFYQLKKIINNLNKMRVKPSFISTISLLKKMLLSLIGLNFSEKKSMLLLSFSFKSIRFFFSKNDKLLAFSSSANVELMTEEISLKKGSISFFYFEEIIVLYI